jgi:major membrane immunogen (membrane-anchored lipoprotein)
MKDFFTKSRVFTILAMVIAASGLIGPEVTALSPLAGKIVGIVGLVAAACGQTLTSKHPDLDASTFDVNKFRNLGMVLLVVPVLCLTLLTTGCSDSQIKKAATATNVAASAEATSIDVKHDLKAENAIDDQGELKITRAQKDFNDALTELNDKALCYRSSDPNARQGISDALQRVSDSLGRLLEQGTLHIKNPEAKAKFTLGLAVANTSFRVMQLFLKSAPNEGAELSPDILAICQSTSQQLKENATRLNDDLVRLTTPM